MGGKKLEISEPKESDFIVRERGYLSREQLGLVGSERLRIGFIERLFYYKDLKPTLFLGT